MTKAQSASEQSDIVLNVVVVEFHHARGPEIEFIYPELKGSGQKLPENLSLLPFLGLPDGCHLFDETVTYFTLRNPQLDQNCPAIRPTVDVDNRATADIDSFPRSVDANVGTNPGFVDAHPVANPVQGKPTIFGISCARQCQSVDLKDRPDDVTRDTIQKAVIVLLSRPVFGLIKDRLCIVTQAYFAQRDFGDKDILERFFGAMVDTFQRGYDESSFFYGLSIKDLITKFKRRTVILLKALIMGKRLLFFSINPQDSCIAQLSLISTIPGLIQTLDDACDPEFSTFEDNHSRATSLQSSNRQSLLDFMGLPYCVFSKSSFFWPYASLQQVETIKSFSPRSFMLGSTNKIVWNRRAEFADVAVNVDEGVVEITNPKTKQELQLSSLDIKWINELYTSITSPEQQNASVFEKTEFAGSEDFFRQRFESYIFSLCAACRYDRLLKEDRSLTPEAQSREASKALSAFSLTWINAWQQTHIYKSWDRIAHEDICNVIEPLHPAIAAVTAQENEGRLSRARETFSRSIFNKTTRFSTALSSMLLDNHDGVLQTDIQTDMSRTSSQLSSGKDDSAVEDETLERSSSRSWNLKYLRNWRRSSDRQLSNDAI